MKGRRERRQGGETNRSTSTTSSSKLACPIAWREAKSSGKKKGEEKEQLSENRKDRNVKVTPFLLQSGGESKRLQEDKLKKIPGWEITPDQQTREIQSGIKAKATDKHRHVRVNQSADVAQRRRRQKRKR